MEYLCRTGSRLLFINSNCRRNSIDTDFVAVLLVIEYAILHVGLGVENDIQTNRLAYTFLYFAFSFKY